MKTIHIYLLAIVTMLLTQSCIVHNSKEDFGPNTTRTVAVTDFDEVELSGGLNYIYIEGSTPKVTIKGPSKLIDRVEVTQQGKKLRATTKQKSGHGRIFGKNPDDLITVTIQSPTLRNVHVGGAAELKAKRIRTSGDFLLKASGASDLELGTLLCANAEMSASGSSDVEIQRVECGNLLWQVSGASDVKVEKAECHSASAKASGSSDVELDLTGTETTTAEASGASDVELRFNRCGTAQATASGSSNIELKGTLRALSKEASGSSTIDERELRLGR